MQEAPLRTTANVWGINCMQEVLFVRIFTQTLGMPMSSPSPSPRHSLSLSLSPSPSPSPSLSLNPGSEPAASYRCGAICLLLLFVAVVCGCCCCHIEYSGHWVTWFAVVAVAVVAFLAAWLRQYWNRKLGSTLLSTSPFLVSAWLPLVRLVEAPWGRVPL